MSNRKYKRLLTVTIKILPYFKLTLKKLPMRLMTDLFSGDATVRHKLNQVTVTGWVVRP